MCRNIRTLYNFEPPATEDEVRAAALQYVRKVSGFTRPSRANAEAFERAVDAVADVSLRLLDGAVDHRGPEGPRGRGGEGPGPRGAAPGGLTRPAATAVIDHVVIGVRDLDSGRAFHHPGYYGAFVLDPDGHNIEAVIHGSPDGG